MKNKHMPRHWWRLVPALAITIVLMGMLWGVFADVNVALGFSTAADTCFATPDAGATVFSSADSQAVRDAAAAAVADGTVQIAGTCAGTVSGFLVNLTKPLTLLGGYQVITQTNSVNWGVRDADLYPTTLDGLGNGRVIGSNSDLRLEDLTITGGQAESSGGGVMLDGTLTMTGVTVTANRSNGEGGGVSVNGSLYMVNSTVEGNFADAAGGGVRVINGEAHISGSTFSGNSSNGPGGGIYNFQAPLIVTATTFFSNTTLSSSGGGGGAVMEDDATITGSSFLSNTATGGIGGGLLVEGEATVLASTFTGNVSGHSGGGGAFPGTATISGTTFTGNVALNNGGGGGMFAKTGTVTNSRFEKNQSSQYIGGGLFIDADGTLAHTIFLHNRAGNQGGGAFIGGEATLTATTFLSNTAATDGGGALLFSPATLQETIFISNTARGTGGGLHLRNTASITAATFISNTAAAGGGVDARGTAQITGTTFIDNFGGEGGGGALLRSTGYVTGTTFLSNTALLGGGLAAAGVVTITQTSFEDNFAVQGGGAWIDREARIEQSSLVNNTATESGGALWFNGNSSAAVFVVNTLLADNRAAGNHGHALAWLGIVTGSQITLIHNTLAQSSTQDGSAIYVTGGTLAITNTIIASQAIAIERKNGVVSEDFNLFATVSTPFSGTVTAGTHSITGTAAFVDPATGDYQLTAFSDAIDAGTNAGVSVDYFGEVRPQRGGFDIGFDESPFVAPFTLLARQPLPNAISVSVTTPISAVFDAKPAAASVTSRTFAVQTSFGGLLTGTASVAGNAISIAPVRPFFAGERVQVIATDQIRSTDDAWLKSVQWGFSAGPVIDRCIGRFTEIGLSLEAPGLGPVAWGDYDNDGDLDVLVAGNDSNRSLTRLYRNDGAGAFSSVNTSLPGISSGTVDWADYDSDGDLDILITGKAQSDWISRLYRNDNGSFVEAGAADDAFVGLNLSSTAWGDYDNDGDLDVVLSGETGGGNGVTKLYRNEQGTFVDVEAGLAAVFRSAVAWGDYDNDGDLDLLVSGTTDSGRLPSVTLIYRNDRGVFVDINADLPGLSLSRAAWGDFDNDSDLDLLISGHDNNVIVARVYRNDGGSFVNANAVLMGAVEGQLGWGDYDNDGDLDILITGLQAAGNGFASVAKVYRNDNAAFVEVAIDFLQAGFVGGSWGDYDNDGDLDVLVQSVEDAGNFSLQNPQLKLYRNDDCDRIYLPNVVRE